MSLNRHISRTYSFNPFAKGFVEILAAQQDADNQGWYEGTADAVRRNLRYLREQNADYYLILAGDQLYHMDFQQIITHHIETKADVTMTVVPVPSEQVSNFGIVRIDKGGLIQELIEKPCVEQLDETIRYHDQLYLASTGIYCFNAHLLEKVLDNKYADFGYEILPEIVKKFRCMSYIFKKFWSDIGTIKNFFEKSISIAAFDAEFSFKDNESPIYTRLRRLPNARVYRGYIGNSIISEGAIIEEASIHSSLVGIRTHIGKRVKFDKVIHMGSDYYEQKERMQDDLEKMPPPVGVGHNTHIRNTIIDKNVHIGSGCRIGWDDVPRPNADYLNYSVRNGIVIIPKNAVIPDDTVI